MTGAVPRLNHVAFHVATRRQVDELTAEALLHGWKLMFTDLHPYRRAVRSITRPIWKTPTASKPSSSCQLDRQAGFVSAASNPLQTRIRCRPESAADSTWRY